MGTFYWGQNIPILKKENIIQDFPEFLCLWQNQLADFFIISRGLIHKTVWEPANFLSA